MRLRQLLAPVAVAAAGTLAVAPLVDAGQGRDNNRHERRHERHKHKQRFNQKFVIQETFTDDPGTVSAHGLIDAEGLDVIISDTTDLFDFPEGDLTIVHDNVGDPREHFNEETCEFSFFERGVWIIQSGTEAYEGYTGNGYYVVHGEGQSDRNPDGTCIPDSGTGSITVVLRGNVSPPEPAES